MSTISLRDARTIGQGEKPYIVAELNTSHFGSVDLAKEMIEQAKNAGCDCVKFQSWSPASINSKSFYDENLIAGRIYQKFSFTEDKLLTVAQFCKELGIAFSSTP
jgi:N-acetylneuraminate synthase